MTNRSSTNYQRHAWGFFAPGAVLVAIVIYLPVLYTFYLSLTSYNGLGNPKFTGFSNYFTMFTDEAFKSAAGNTFLWAVGTVLIPVSLGLFMAYLTFGLKGGALLRVPFLIPYAFSGVGIGVVWSFVLQDGGALTQALQFLHLPFANFRWLEDAPLNTLVMILASSWQGVGVNALLFTVGLQSIPKEPLEAARLDGATGLRLFTSIVSPMLRPLTTVVVGLAIVNGLKTFDIVQAMTLGGPGRNSENLAVTMYRDAFVNSDYGLGSSVAIVLSIVTVGASIVYLRRQLKPDNPGTS